VWQGARGIVAAAFELQSQPHVRKAHQPGERNMERQDTAVVTSGGAMAKWWGLRVVEQPAVLSIRKSG